MGSLRWELDKVTSVKISTMIIQPNTDRMKLISHLYLSLLSISASYTMSNPAEDKPNILLIVADDLGWNDVP